jgi:hypothetical protein
VTSEALREAGTDSDHSALPRWLAWVVGFRHSAAWLGAATGAAYLLVAAGVLAALGRPTGLGWTDFATVHLTYALWYASIPVAAAILVRGVQSDARRLAPVLGAPADGRGSLPREVLAVPRGAVWLGIGVGVLMTIAAVEFFAALGPAMHMGLTFVSLREILIELALFAVMGWAAGAAVRLSQLTEARARPDLLDPSAFAPLVRNGTRLAAVWLVLVAIGVPGSMTAPEVFSEAARTVFAMTLAFASLAAIALILPCRGAHQVLRSARRAELELVRGQIAEARREREDVRLPGLLAWEARVEAISEWPIDARALGRTGLFVLLPLASWIGAALVERWVDTLVGSA